MLTRYHWQNEALVVVGVFADQVHPSRRTHRYHPWSLFTVGLHVHSASFCQELSHSWKRTSHGVMLAVYELEMTGYRQQKNCQFDDSA